MVVAHLYRSEQQTCSVAEPPGDGTKHLRAAVVCNISQLVADEYATSVTTRVGGSEALRNKV